MTIFNILDRCYENYYIKGMEVVNFINETIHNGDRINILGTGISDYYKDIDEEINSRLITENINTSNLDECKEILMIDSKIEDIESERSFNRVINKIQENIINSGFIVLRIINFDKLINNGILELPIIEVKIDNKNFKLQKVYNYNKENEKVEIIYLIYDCDNKEVVRESKVLDYTMRKQQLIFLLNNIGIKELEFYSSFIKEEYYEDNSNFLIVRGIKKEELLKESPEYEEYDSNVVLKKGGCAKGNCSSCSKLNTNGCCKNKNNIILRKNN